jgi:hypothetical protein
MTRTQALGAVPTVAIRKLACAGLGGVQGPQASVGVASQLFGMGMAKTLVDGISVTPLPINVEATLLRMTFGATHYGSVVPAS